VCACGGGGGCVCVCVCAYAVYSLRCVHMLYRAQRMVYATESSELRKSMRPYATTSV
jgi:hypothetical protein